LGYLVDGLGHALVDGRLQNDGQLLGNELELALGDYGRWTFVMVFTKSGLCSKDFFMRTISVF
jgi:hypothetical protein